MNKLQEKLHQATREELIFVLSNELTNEELKTIILNLDTERLECILENI